MELAGSGGWLFTARLSSHTHPWLNEHRVGDTICVPGAALVESVLKAGAEVGCEVVEEITITAPLVVPDEGRLHLQVLVAAPDSDGLRGVTVFARSNPTTEWALHAEGRLSQLREESEGDLSHWPPPGSEPVAVDDLYERFEHAGLHYGPKFRGVRTAWRLGDEMFTEVGPTTDVASAGFLLHPALFDAAVHSAAVAADGSENRLPFSWEGVTLHSTNASALRVRITPTGPNRVAVFAADQDGRPVVSIDALGLRAVAAPSPDGEGQLHRPAWVETAPSVAPVEPDADWAVVGGDDPLTEGGRPWEVARFADLHGLREDLNSGTPAPSVVVVPLVAVEGTDAAAAARSTTAHILALVQDWLGDPRFGASTLVFLSRTAPSAPPVPSYTAVAAARALVRSAQTEHPGRFHLVECDRNELGTAELARALTLGEPHVLLRDGGVFVRDLVRDEAVGTVPDWGDSALITGGTGALGSQVARHLVAVHGVRRIVLASRRGSAAPGAESLVAELTELGAEVHVRSVDLTDREAAASLLADQPVTAVVHAAGVVVDRVLESLRSEDVTAVFEPKVDVALHLHELTQDSDLRAFVLFSSVAGVLGAPGQGNYAAANGFLDALAEQRHAAGLPATSIAWGLWETPSGLTAALGERDRSRMVSAGVQPMSAESGLDLLDRAVAASAPLWVGARILPDRLPAQAGGSFAARTRRIGSAGTTRPAGNTPREERLVVRLRQLSGAQRSQAALSAVLTETARVLGHNGTGSLRGDRDFKELGFDSLTAVELRNRLDEVTGMRLPASLAFDHPNPRALAEYLLSLLREHESATEQEERVRRLLADLPLARLREAGLLDGLLGLVDEPVSTVRRTDDQIDAMEADDLVEMALRQNS
ncbi:SDR family NAD(P)-dependent oxidoreductase [Streptomyces sp. NPDC005955]|uniref:type I polyketide synthase n=1 Tax=Streptomyces sp. NPDC005955 TaxID=3364738 RepID=UPI00369A619A